MNIHFVNYSLGYGIGGRKMQGYSGKVYGKLSRWSDKFKAQTVTIDLNEADYIAVVKDLSRAWDLSQRKWVPVPEFSGSKLVDEPAPHGNDPFADFSIEHPHEIPAAGVVVTDATPEPLSAGSKFFTLKGVAAEEGVDIAHCKTNAERYAAIAAHRLSPPAAALPE